MKKYFLTGSAMLVLGGFLASCTHDDLDYSSIVENKKAEYQEVFVNTYGRINPNQTWGFGSAPATTKGLTRAVFTDKWTDNHSCNWESKLSFTLPAGAIDVTQPNFDKNGSVYYIPEGTTGEVSLGWLGFNEGAELYNYGNITAINDVNYNGKITIYNAGTMTNFGPTSGGRHTVINTGSLTVCGYANIGDLYNSGTLVCEREHNPWWPNEGAKLGTIDHDVSIYSAGEDAVILMPDGCTHLDAKLDVHNKIYVDGDMEFQNDDQTRYVCELEVTGELYLNKGALYTAAITAGSIKMNAFPLYLRQGAHVITGNFDIDPSGTHVYGHTNSNALIEVKSFTFKNKNDLTHTFSDNIYFQVSDYIQINGCYKNAHSDGSGQDHYYTNMADYLANTEDEYNLVAGRLNAGDAAGSPACGEAWSIGTPDDGNDQKTEVITTTEELEITELIEQGRVFCEDLGDIGDFDFNDVVFDAYVYKTVKGIRTTVKKNNVVVSETVDIDESTSTYNTEIVLLAAGGTLQLSVAGYEVHNEMGGSPVSTIINTITKADSAYHNSFVTVDPVVLGKDFPYSSIIDIPIIVKYNQEVLELAAHPGDAPHKILVPIGTKWCQERERIEEAYPGFRDYVGNLDNNIWENRVDSQLFNHPKDTYKPRSMEPVTTIIRTSTETTYE